MNGLLIRQILDEFDNNVVQRAENVVDNTPGITKELEDKQIRNVISVAEDTHSIAVVGNFIKYQIGRSYDSRKPNQKWCFPDKEGRRFGDALLADFDWLKVLAQSNASINVSAEELAIRLVRRYLGYLVRHFKYAQVTQGGS